MILAELNPNKNRVKTELEPCEDCVSRQEAINCVTLNEFRYKIVEDMKTLPSVVPKEKTRWIPVSERLPEDFQRVLVTVVNYYGNKVVRVAEYYGEKRFCVKETDELWEVGEKGLLAWMPLPEPYKAESEK